jgi:hypothetical protein
MDILAKKPEEKSSVGICKRIMDDNIIMDLKEVAYRVMRSIRVAWNVVSFMNIFMDSRFFYNVGSP